MGRIHVVFSCPAQRTRRHHVTPSLIKLSLEDMTAPPTYTCLSIDDAPTLKTMNAKSCGSCRIKVLSCTFCDCCRAVFVRGKKGMGGRKQGSPLVYSKYYPAYRNVRVFFHFQTRLQPYSCYLKRHRHLFRRRSLVLIYI